VWHCSAQAGRCMHGSAAEAADEHCSHRGRQEEADFGEEPSVRHRSLPPPALAAPTRSSPASGDEKRRTMTTADCVAYQPVRRGPTWQPTFPHDLLESGDRVSALETECSWRLRCAGVHELAIDTDADPRLGARARRLRCSCARNRSRPTPASTSATLPNRCGADTHGCKNARTREHRSTRTNGEAMNTTRRNGR